MKRCTSILLLLAIVVVVVCPILPLHLHRIIKNPYVAPECTLEMLITGVPLVENMNAIPWVFLSERLGHSRNRR
jgi:hypothetical protein